MKDNKTIAVVPGSFDPITYGHINIAKRAADMYDVVYLAVMINDQKKYLFTLEEREQIAKSALEDIENVTVISSDGMLWKLAEELCADAIVKGYRNQADYEYEQKMAEFNATYNPHAKTVLLKSDDALQSLSSTVVRQRLDAGMSIDSCLPNRTEQLIKSILTTKNNFS